MLLSGQVDAAGLPEPFLTAALARGAAIVGTTEQYGVDAAVILFSKAFLDTRLDDVRRMYKAYASAAARINADESSYRAFLVKKAAFPAEASESYRFVRYREPTLPALGQVGAAVAWLEARGLLKAGIEAASLIDGRAVAAW